MHQEIADPAFDLDPYFQRAHLIPEVGVAFLEVLDIVDRLEENGAFGIVDVLEGGDNVGEILEAVANRTTSFLFRGDMVATFFFLGQEFFMRFVAAGRRGE